MWVRTEAARAAFPRNGTEARQWSAVQEAPIPTRYAGRAPIRERDEEEIDEEMQMIESKEQVEKSKIRLAELKVSTRFS